jgi:predicted enzyme related to lactoylglutathione lyase
MRGDLMSQREEYSAGVPCWVETLQPEPRAALDYYGALLGWEFAGPGPMPGRLPGEYFVARVQGRDVAGVGSLPSLGEQPAPSWNTYVRVDSADEAAERAKAAGANLLIGPLDALPAGRLAVIVDPVGAVVGLWEARAREGAQLVNEPGTWAMSSLHTTDGEGAKAFYGSVFGWEPQAFGSPEAQMTLWRLPGYVGGEGKWATVPSDVVAVMAPTGDAAAAVPPHWNVNLRVENADATVEQATTLGGQVIVPALDTPGFRSAVLADPQGAVFSIGQLTTGP